MKLSDKNQKPNKPRPQNIPQPKESPRPEKRDLPRPGTNNPTPGKGGGRPPARG